MIFLDFDFGQIIKQFFQVGLDQLGLFRVAQNFQHIVVRNEIKARKNVSFRFQISAN